MLFITLRINEVVKVGSNITVKLCGFTTTREAKIGVEAPGDVGIWRAELLERVQGKATTGGERG